MDPKLLMALALTSRALRYRRSSTWVGESLPCNARGPEDGVLRREMNAEPGLGRVAGGKEAVRGRQDWAGASL
ncbi:MAG: hypothetical protein ACREAC_24365 [Blastocatellia bacterium]